MKLMQVLVTVLHRDVTPFTGVWIEILIRPVSSPPKTVTPFTGVWIEIIIMLKLFRFLKSHTLHGCVD